MSTMRTPGVYFMPRDEYDHLPRLNWSKLKHLEKSAQHFQYYLLNEDEDTDARKLGRAVHLAVFEPELFRATCVVWDCGARRGKDWEAFVKRNEGKEILTENQHASALAISQSVRNHAIAQKYIAGGQGEATVLWEYLSPMTAEAPGFKLECKSRPDFLTDSGWLVDLKKVRDASPAGFGRAVWNYRYHAQAAFYVDAIKSVTGQERPVAFVAVEEKPPHVVQVYRLTQEQLELGRTTYRELLSTYNQCRSKNRWPGYADNELDVELPPYALPHEEDVEDLGITISPQPAIGFGPT